MKLFLGRLSNLGKYVKSDTKQTILGRYSNNHLALFLKRSSTDCQELISHEPSDVNDNVHKPTLQYKLAENYEREINQTFIYVKNRRMRYSRSVIMLEGKRLIQDALRAKLTPKILLVNRHGVLDDFDLPSQCYDANKTPLYKARYDYIQLWSDLTTSPGIIGIFDMPTVLANKPPVGAAPVTIICDNVREPGNLGSILRIAASVPVNKVLITKGCVDLWDSKVIRSSCGSHFRIPIFHGTSWEEIKENEGSVLLADCSWFSDYESELQDNVKPQHKQDARSSLTVPVAPYHSVRYDKLPSIILIIGGETEGLSDQALQFANERQGVRVNIPLSNYVDSLNSGVALGVILFEIKRRLLQSDEQ